MVKAETDRKTQKGFQMTKNFEEWCDEFDRIASKEGAGDYTKKCGRESFKEMFEDGLSPDDAWLEEKLAGI